jgi:histone H3/H4
MSRTRAQTTVAPKPKAMPKFSPVASGASRAAGARGKRRHRAVKDAHPMRVYVARLLRKAADGQGLTISRQAVSVMTCLIEREARDIAARAGRAAAFERVSTLQVRHLANPLSLIYARTPSLADEMQLHAAKAVQRYIASRGQEPAKTVTFAAPLPSVPEAGYDDDEGSDESDSKSVAV